MNKNLQILNKYWGYSSFRPLQEEIINSVLEGKDTLALLPTGGGKSITFQVPALVKDGICIVVTPLIALMKDQTEALQKKGIKAISIYSGMSKGEIDIALENCIYGDFKFLYCSPERLATDIFKARVVKMNVNLIAVDESHCISQWGYDFRPSYLKITELRDLLPSVPILALTATATSDVVDDIQVKLDFKQKNVLRSSFMRSNLAYHVREDEDKQRSLLKIASNIKGSGIVYVRSRMKSKEIALFLTKNGISADYYHAGLSDNLRSERQNDWMQGKTRVIVSTNAFGMGIDKADVRFVVHMDLPDSIESYFQEAGRAGRDGKKSFAILLNNSTDKLSIQKREEVHFPDIKTIKNIYNALGNFFQLAIGAGRYMAYDFNIYDFAKVFGVNVQLAYSSIKILEQEGYIELTDVLNNPSKVHFIIQRDDLYKFQVANAHFDGFIKLLLRSYTGLFSEYVNIDESALARRAGISTDEVYKYIKKLSSLKIISFIPRRNNPVITYLEERLEEKSLHIPFESYTSRKDRYISKLYKMLNYAESSNKCRSQILLYYFGEKESYRCAHCDVCLKRNELELSKYEFDLILEDLKKISDGAYVMEDMINQLSDRFKEDKVIKVYQWLIDNGKINWDESGRVFWVKKKEE